MVVHSARKFGQQLRSIHIIRMFFSHSFNYLYDFEKDSIIDFILFYSLIPTFAFIRIQNRKRILTHFFLNIFNLKCTLPIKMPYVPPKSNANFNSPRHLTLS